MSAIFNELFFRPVLNLLIFIYNSIPGSDLGIAIILLTIIIKLVLYPLSKQALKSQKALQDLQPKMNALKERYKNEKEKLAQEMMKLYKEQKVNPLSSCLPLLIQLPFLFAVFRVFSNGLSGDVGGHLYSFIANPGVLNASFLGLINLSSPSPILGVLAGASQFAQTRMLGIKRPEVKSKESKDEDVMALVNKQMMYMMPAITVFLGFSFPAGLMLYWFVTTILTILQQRLLFKKGEGVAAVPF